MADSGLLYYMNLPYKEEITIDKNGKFKGKVVELKGCSAKGNTEKECKLNLVRAKIDWFEEAISTGKFIPMPEKICRGDA